MTEYVAPGLSLFAGLVILVVGGEFLVRGASALAVAARISPLVVGLTVVAFGTSSPELTVSMQASLAGQADIALGNVVGSNIFNLLAVLGISALLAPEGVPVSRSVLVFDFPVMLVVAVACLPIFFGGGVIARWEGIFFLAYNGFYTTYVILVAWGSPLARTLGSVLLLYVAPLTVVALMTSVVATLRTLQRGT